MGREIRKVPPTWQHPVDPATGRHIPLIDGASFAPDTPEWRDRIRAVADSLNAVIEAACPGNLSP